jgi:hypothetical protein
MIARHTISLFQINMQEWIGILKIKVSYSKDFSTTTITYTMSKSVENGVSSSFQNMKETLSKGGCSEFRLMNVLKDTAYPVDQTG